jgi:hypothetical protein
MRLPVVSHPAQQILLGQAGGPQVVLDVVLAPRRPADDHHDDSEDDDNDEDDSEDDGSEDEDDDDGSDDIDNDDDDDDSDMDGCMCAALPYIMLPA